MKPSPARCSCQSIDARVSAIERCRTAALGGHVAACTDCTHTQIAYNSCRIRHCGMLANANRAANLARARQLLAMPAPVADDDQTVDQANEPSGNTYPCPACGGRMVIIETFEPGATPAHSRQRAPPQCPSDIP